MCLVQFERSLHCLLLSRSRHDFGSVRAAIILFVDKSQLKVPQVLARKWLPLNVSSAPLLCGTRFDKGPFLTQWSRFRSWFGSFFFRFPTQWVRRCPGFSFGGASSFLHSSCLAAVERPSLHSSTFWSPWLPVLTGTIDTAFKYSHEHITFLLNRLPWLAVTEWIFAWLQEGEKKKIPSPTCLTRIKIIADKN